MKHRENNSLTENIFKILSLFINTVMHSGIVRYLFQLSHLNLEVNFKMEITFQIQLKKFISEKQIRLRYKYNDYVEKKKSEFI